MAVENLGRIDGRANPFATAAIRRRRTRTTHAADVGAAHESGCSGISHSTGCSIEDVCSWVANQIIKVNINSKLTFKVIRVVRIHRKIAAATNKLPIGIKGPEMRLIVRRQP